MVRAVVFCGFLKTNSHKTWILVNTIKLVEYFQVVDIQLIDCFGTILLV